MPDTRVQLFRRARPLVAPALGEACLTLVRNDVVMNLLIAETAAWRDDALHLEQVTWFCAHCDRSLTRRLDAVRLHRGGDAIWRATDQTSGRIIRQPSVIPYHVIFIDDDERLRLAEALTTGDGMTVFTAAQQHFGTLPGFDFGNEVLISPRGYATVPTTPDDYLPE